MKIITWNVNGLRACIENNFIQSIQQVDADVICIQETKCSPKQIDLKVDGYTQYWNSSRRNGYSGVLVLTKIEPLSVRLGFGNDKFDIEGRSITIEFDDFFIINVYMPLSRSRLQRSEYRSEWDDTLLKYMSTLSKPIILCGDFNVAHSYLDIYEENLRNIESPPGFKESERANFDRLLNCGFIDVFRQQNSNKREYTWWSNRGKKREQNRGWRLDYFLVQAAIYNKVSSLCILQDIMGSDHCPVQLEIDIQMSPDAASKNRKLAEQWDSIDWNSYERALLKMQTELAQATADRDRTLAYEIQNKILTSSVAKALAVRHVSNTQSEAGVDGIRWVSSAEKQKAALSLDENTFFPSPTKSIVIFDGRKDRRINIPTYEDRAIQTLIRYALEPVAETTADRKSFGFRKHRSAFDAMTYAKMTLEQSPDLWVFRGDVKSYYDMISHQWIFEHLPMRQSLKKLLKAGFLMNGELFPTECGISQGSGLSPVVGNMVLDRLQTHIHRTLYNNGSIENYAYGDLVRFADDFIVYAQSYEEAYQIQESVKRFLAERGLRLSPEKSYIVKASEGFDFLGWHFEQAGKASLVTPSAQGVKEFESRMEHKILHHNGSVEDLIRSINKSIVGYANYHRVVEAMETFRHLDVVIQALLIKKVKKLHPQRPWKQLKSMYWYRNEKDEEIFSAPNQRSLHVIQMKHISTCFHYAIRTDFNYFLNTEYYAGLEEQRKIDRHSGKYKKLWTSQDGKCYLCGRPMLCDQFLRVVRFPKIGEVYIHSRCKESLLEYHMDRDFTSGVDVIDLLDEVSRPQPFIETIYTGLNQFFCKENRQVFTLTFTEIEELLGEILPDESAEKAFWYDRHESAIAHCWLANGYIIQRLNIEKQKVVYRKENHNLTTFEIPEKLLQHKIPKNAQDELSSFFRYIIHKYKL